MGANFGRAKKGEGKNEKPRHCIRLRNYAKRGFLNGYSGVAKTSRDSENKPGTRIDIRRYVSTVEESHNEQRIHLRKSILCPDNPDHL